MFQNVIINVFEKSKAFVVNAGKIIFTITIIIWFLGSHGISENYKNAEKHTQELASKNNWDITEQDNYLKSYKSENSLLGNIGKTIEPVFRPLGYDWRTSIAVLGSFAARETFVSTLATIYSLGTDIDIEDEEGQKTIIARLKTETTPNGTLVFSLATGVSILLFFAFAMQCISTFAIVRKETNSWKWPIIQWVGMTGFAYLVAFIAFQLLK